MKKITTILAASFLAVAFCSVANAQISVGAGYGLANHTLKVDGKKYKGDDNKTGAMSGFWIGGTYDWNFMSANWGELALQPGLTYQFFGKTLEKEKGTEDGENYSYKSSRKDHYLDIPVSVKYSYDLMPGKLKTYAYAGPVFSFGLSAKNKYTSKYGNEWEKGYQNLYNGKYMHKDSEGNKEEGKLDGTDYSMFDLKLGLGIGATVMDMFDVKLGFNIGLLNRYTGDTRKESKASTHTNVFYFGVAYNF